MKKTGNLFVVSAPSGAGKSTLCRIIRSRYPELAYSVSATTRSPRPGEKNGEDYNFLKIDEFKQYIKDGCFLEWAEIFGNYYGTEKEATLDKLKSGKNILVEVDVLGGAAIKKNWPDAILIFMVPPTLDELSCRLNARNTENPLEIKNRLSRVAEEVSQRFYYDYLIINGDLDKAADEFAKIIAGGKGCLMKDMEKFWPKFFINHPTLNWRVEDLNHSLEISRRL